jgi:hypothetical protein
MPKHHVSRMWSISHYLITIIKYFLNKRFPFIPLRLIRDIICSIEKSFMDGMECEFSPLNSCNVPWTR